MKGSLQLFLSLLLLATLSDYTNQSQTPLLRRPSSSSAAANKSRHLQTSLTLISYVGNNGDFDAPYPLSICQGDCDEDQDCSGSLICKDRNRNEDVEGCIGGAQDDTDNDYCVQGPPTIPTPSPTYPPGTEMARLIGNPPDIPLDRPLGHCEGDCDSDWDCEGDLICMQRDEDEQVNGCYFDPNNSEMRLKDPLDLCVYKRFSPAPTTLSPTRAPTPFPTPGPPPEPAMAWFVGNPASNLNRCEGDCDGDNDCQGNLMCYSRNGDDDVPGCYFDSSVGGMSRSDGDDLCIDRKSLGHKHRLRLYWERGYDWQESSREQYFCLQTEGSDLVVRRCSSNSRQLFEFIYLYPSGEALIRADRDGRCLEGRRLENCDADDEDQRWFPYNGRWQDVKFELSRKVDDEDCLSPHHHPRDGERAYMLDCEEERKYTTNAWELY